MTHSSCASSTSSLQPGQAKLPSLLVLDDLLATGDMPETFLSCGGGAFAVERASQLSEALEKMGRASLESRSFGVAIIHLASGAPSALRQVSRMAPDMQILCTTDEAAPEEEVLGNAELCGRLCLLKRPFEKYEVTQLVRLLAEKWRLHEERKDKLETEEEQRKKLEEQYREQSAQLLRSQRMESVGRLASGIAHDMNNILAPILLSVFMLRRQLPPEEFEKTLVNVENNTKRGADLVKQLLIFGKGAGGRREVVRLQSLFKDMEKLITGTFPKNVVLVSEVAADMWPVMGDGTQLHQVLLNLCVNARDAMPNGGSLTLGSKNVHFDDNYAAMHPDAKVGPYLCLRVADTGEGIPPEVMDKIFDPFFTTKEQGNGTGLGLSTVMGIVKGHGGFVNLCSKVGVGTTFEIFVPASPQALETPAVAPASSHRRGRGEKILVVDDEEGIRHVLQKTLQHNGYQVLAAGDGIEAIVQYSQHQGEIKAVLTDIMMPFMDGVTMARALKRINPEVKIIASSGIGSARDKEDKTAELNAMGVTTFLSKPYTAAEILAAIGSLIHEEKPALAAV